MLFVCISIIEGRLHNLMCYSILLLLLFTLVYTLSSALTLCSILVVATVFTARSRVARSIRSACAELSAAQPRVLLLLRRGHDQAARVRWLPA